MSYFFLSVLLNHLNLNMNTTTGRERNFIIFALIVTLASCKARIVSVQEGEMAKLDFSYPCNCTRITLQYGYRDPFYSSANPKYLLIPSNQKLDVNTGNDSCSIELVINSVSRDDAGTYILTAYKNGIPLADLPGMKNVYLYVDYSPGKASCELNDYPQDEEWVSLQCAAPLGTLQGRIDCYQNGVHLPNRNELIETDVNVKQIILARQDSPVYCCSSILSAIKDECECTDWGWDPISNSFLDVVDPCAEISTQYPEINTKTTFDSTNIFKSPKCPIDYTCIKIYSFWRDKIIAVVFLTCIAMYVLLVTCLDFRKNSKLNRMKHLLKLHGFREKRGRRIPTPHRGTQSENRDSCLLLENEDESTA